MGDPDEFHDDAHPEAREITGDRDYGEWGQCIATASSTDERCRGYAKGPHGKCYNHGGSTPTKEENPDVGNGDQEGNDNAVTHGAFREHFTSMLNDGEQRAFQDAYEQLGDPGSAQDVARAAASVCLLQFQRSGDERFLRRFEGLCDKFNIAPADVQEIEHSGRVDGERELALDEPTKDVVRDVLRERREREADHDE